MLKREDQLLITDILEHAENIFSIVQNQSYEDVVNDKMKLLAII